ncbi:MAG: dTMP kinase [Bacteroidales bacterium]
MLIVIEGLDGAGKSTQVKMLREYLEKGHKIHYIHFPRYQIAPMGEMISKFLRGDYGAIDEVNPQIVALLYAEDRREASKEIKKYLKAGDTVLIDRYVYSNIAFQCAKLNSEKEIEYLRNWILKTEYEYFNIPQPDVNIFLDVPLDFVENRLKENRKGDDRNYLEGKADIHEASMDFQKKVRAIYLAQLEKDENFLRIDCGDNNGSMLAANDIFQQIKKQICKR